MPPKKPTRAKSPASAKRTTPIAAETRPEPTTAETQGSNGETQNSTRMMGVGAIVVVVCVMTAAMLLSARETPAPAAAVDDRADTAVTASATNTSKPAPDVRPATTTVVADASKSLSAKSSSVTITGCLARSNGLGRPGCNNLPARMSAFGTEIDDVVSGLDEVEMMLDQQDGVPGVHQPVQRFQQTLDVGQVQTGRRFVQDVDGLLLSLEDAELSGDFDPLRFAAR